MLSLHLSNSTKSPAWATLTLISNSINSSFFDPVNLRWEIIGLEFHDSNIRSSISWDIVGNSLPFSGSPITKFVESNSRSLVWLHVELNDLLVGLCKLNVSELILLKCGISLTKLGNIVCEDLRVVTWSRDSSNKSCKNSFRKHIKYKIDQSYLLS